MSLPPSSPYFGLVGYPSGGANPVYDGNNRQGIEETAVIPVQGALLVNGSSVVTVGIPVRTQGNFVRFI